MSHYWTMFKPYFWVTLWLVLAVLTLIPASASKACMLGYDALCTFTPVSTVILLALAGLTYRGVRKKLAVVTPPEQQPLVEAGD